MKNVKKIKKGETYFHVTFFDKELSIPSIETYVYDGADEEDENQILFKNAEGFVAASEGSENIETYYISFEQDKINCIVDKEHLIEWLKEEHSSQLVATEYVYKIL